MDIDRQTDEIMEMVSQGARLTTSLINYVFTELADALEKDKNQVVMDNKTKEGRQSIKSLLNKHKEGIKTLDDNLTKEQVKDYQKHLNKLGVDFSVVKNGRDDYSFFFAGSQAEVIEKGLRNVVELKSKVLSDEKVKDAQLDLDSELSKYSEKEIENVELAYGNYLSKDEEKDLGNEEKENVIPEREELTDREKVLFDKIKKIDETQKEVQEEILSSEDILSTEKELDLTENEIEVTQNIFNAYKEKSEEIESDEELSHEEKKLRSTLTEKEDVYFDKLKNDLESERNPVNTKKEQSKEILNNELSQLSNSELKYFEKKMEYENSATAPVFDQNKTYKLAEELKEMKKDIPANKLEKINNIDKDIRDLNNFSEVSKGSKLNANEILRETKYLVSERSNEKKNTKKFSIENLKNLYNKIKREDRNNEKERKPKEHSL